MSRFPEQQLWDDLRECMRGHWYARRIEDRLGGGLPDLMFALKKRKSRWMELKVLDKLPSERRAFDIGHFTADQRAFGLQMAEYGGIESWFLMTRVADIDHLHNTRVIDTLGEFNYKHFRNSALWTGRLSDEGVAVKLIQKLAR